MTASGDMQAMQQDVLSHSRPVTIVATASSREASHIDALDALRGLAILLVVVGHYAPERLAYGLAADILRPWAQGGVILFFLLSGFLIENNLFRHRDPVAYGLRRIFRIAPAYWVSILCFLAIDRLALGDNSYSLSEVIVNAALLQDVFKVVLINAAFWTLLIEAKFYVVAPVIVRAGDTAIRVLPYLTMALNAVIFARRGEASNLLLYITVCFVGMNFGLWHRGGLSAWALAALCSCAALSMAFIAPYFTIGMTVFTGVNSALLAYALMYGLRLPGFAFLGAISYSWYLYHGGLGYPMMAAMEATGVAGWAAAGITAMVTMMTAWLSYRLIERPGIALGRGLERRWREKLA